MKDKLKKYPVISICPVCKHDLHVVRLECSHCDAVLEGTFTLSKFNYLETEKLYFIEVFMKNRGSIKAIEKELNVSYPTVKKMLDEVIIGLGYTPDVDGDDASQEDTKAPKTDILGKLERGEFSVADALEALKKGKK